VRAAVPKIGQLTDVSHCKLHQYLCCNGKIKYQAAWPGCAGRDERARPARIGSVRPV